MKPTRFHRVRGRLRGGFALGLLLAALAACGAIDSALDVEAPGRIPVETLDNPDNAALLVEGVLADFDCAFGSYVVVGGLITDELVEATALARRWPYDRRDVQRGDAVYAVFGCQSLGVYTPLSTARYTAEDALRKLEGWTDEQVPSRSELIATAASYSGYAHLLLGEGFCSGVLLGPDLQPGGEVPRTDLFRRAEERFTRAIEAAQAAGDDDLLNLALVGRARVRLDLGELAAAAADARQVPEGFVAVADYSNASGRRRNRVYSENQFSDAVSVGPEYRNLTFGGVPDPRVEVFDDGDIGFDGVTEIFATTKYTDFSSPIELATWEEARLILAEAELAAGNPQAAVDIINTLHDRAGLPPFRSSDLAEIRDHIIEERSRELFLESQRLYDVDRFDLPLDPAPGTLYPKSGVYGDVTCLPLPDVERANNPNIG